MNVNRAIRTAAPLGLAAMLLTLTACAGGRTMERLGLRIPQPDEFQVIERKPLQMPPSASLPEPRPGAASPLDPDPHRDALQAVFGTSDSAVVASVPPSRGEQVLLSSADASATSSYIRVQLEREKIEEEANKSYEPPTIGELLGGRGKEKVDEKEVLDPVVEARRLQRKGLVAPVDPEAELEPDSDGNTQ